MVKYNHRYDPYATHQPVLAEAIKYNNKNARLTILELGSGFNSTELIHELAGWQIENILTVDHDKEWLSKFKHLEDQKHKLIHIETWEDIIKKFSGEYGVVFVDQGDWASRAHCIKYYNQHADLVVLHDSDSYSNEFVVGKENLVDFNDWYLYVKTFMPLKPYPYVTGPPTTIMSNIVDVTKWEIDYAKY